MPGIAANNEHENLEIGFAIGFGCLLGIYEYEVCFAICELLLASGYTKQYHFIKDFLDLDLVSNNDSKYSRISNFAAAIKGISDKFKCVTIFDKLEDFFEGYVVTREIYSKFIYQDSKQDLKNLIIAATECLVAFECCAAIPGIFSTDCLNYVNQYKIIKFDSFKSIAPMLNFLVNGYKYVPVTLEIVYNAVTLELKITLPYCDTETRSISFIELIHYLENIDPYKRRHLSITFSNVKFTGRHYDCILNLKNILREFNIIRELHIDFEWRHVRVESDEPWLRRLIIARILSLTNVKKINFPEVQWWYSRLDQDIRAVKLEDNALYAPLLPIFASLKSERHSFSIEQLEDHSKDPFLNRRLNA